MAAAALCTLELIRAFAREQWRTGTNDIPMAITRLVAALSTMAMFLDLPTCGCEVSSRYVRTVLAGTIEISGAMSLQTFAFLVAQPVPESSWAQADAEHVAIHNELGLFPAWLATWQCNLMAADGVRSDAQVEAAVHWMTDAIDHMPSRWLTLLIEAFSAVRPIVVQIQTSANGVLINQGAPPFSFHASRQQRDTVD